MVATRKLDIHVESAQYSKGLPVRHVAHVLEQLQITIFHIGDSLAGGDFRVRGHPIDYVRDRCDLVFKTVSIGSFQASLMLDDQQTTLTDHPSLGEESLMHFGNILSKLDKGESPNSIKEIIPDPKHRTRILGDYLRLWPGEEDGFKLGIKPPSLNHAITLNPAARLHIQELLNKEKQQKGTEVIGVISHFNMPSDMLRITGPDGSIKLPMDSLDTIKTYLGKPLIVSGDARFDASGNLIDLVRISKIQYLKEISINRVFSEKEELRLLKPVTISVDWQDKSWIMRNNNLGISVYAKDYDECLKQFNNEFLFVWREYGLADDSNFSTSALALRKTLRNVVGEKNHL